MELKTATSIFTLGAASLVASAEPRGHDLVHGVGSVPSMEHSVPLPGISDQNYVQLNNFTFNTTQDEQRVRHAAEPSGAARFNAAIGDVASILTNAVPRPGIGLDAPALEHARAACLEAVHTALYARGVVDGPTLGVAIDLTRESAIRTALDRSNILIDFGFVRRADGFHFSPSLLEFRELPVLDGKTFMPKDLEPFAKHFDRSIQVREVIREIVPFGAALGSNLQREVQGTVMRLPDLSTPVIVVFSGRGRSLKSVCANEVGNIVADSLFRGLDNSQPLFLSCEGERMRCLPIQLKEAFSDLLTLYHTEAPAEFTAMRSEVDIPQYRLARFLAHRAAEKMVGEAHLSELKEASMLASLAQGIDNSARSREAARRIAIEVFRTTLLPSLCELQKISRAPATMK